MLRAFMIDSCPRSSLLTPTASIGLQSSLFEQPFKKDWQVFMVLRSLIIQADLLLSSKKLPRVGDLVTGLVSVNPARSSVVSANDRADPCHEGT
jgi:hypothetical protein